MSSKRKDQVMLEELIYTVNWEDPASDQKALRIGPGDTVMTITSGACNTLVFLLDDPAIVHTVDINPSQSYVLELKMASMRRLEYPEFVRFMGLAPADDRADLYARLRDDLTPAAARFWDDQAKVIRAGLLLRGRYERFVKFIGAMVRLINGRDRVNGLFDDRDLAGQREFYDREWDILRTRIIFALFYNKQVLGRIGLKADYFHFDDGSNSFSESFRRKFRRVVSEVPIRGNYFVHTYLKGCYRSLDEVPEYLREESFPVIKSRLARIRIHTNDAKKWLATMPDRTFDGLALSNICELMSLSDTRRMFEEVLRTAKPGARVSFRNLILPREVPEDLRDSIRKDEKVSREIMAADRAFVYSKVAAYEVRK